MCNLNDVYDASKSEEIKIILIRKNIHTYVLWKMNEFGQ